MDMRFHEAYLVGRLEETKISHQSVCFTRIRDFTWRLSDCVELVVSPNGASIQK